MKRILFATSEAVPFIKTGGLADVAGALPKCFDKTLFRCTRDFTEICLYEAGMERQNGIYHPLLYGSGI